MNSPSFDWSKVESPKVKGSLGKRVTTFEVRSSPMVREYYHLSQILSLSVGRNEDNEPLFHVTLKKDAVSVVRPSGLLNDFLCVIDGKRAYMSNDSEIRSDYHDFVDDFEATYKEKA